MPEIIRTNNEIVTNLFSTRNKARCHMKNARERRRRDALHSTRGYGLEESRLPALVYALIRLCEAPC